MKTTLEADKAAVREFWNRQSCGEVYAVGATLREQLEAQAEERYALEPYIFQFARFPDGRDKDVLEVGVGMGADHLEWAKWNPRSLTGIDLTARAVDLTRSRFEAHGLESNVQCADAECLPFDDESFDIVYSWGVLHHSPDTAQAIREVHRVLRPGGVARVMIYHRESIAGYLLWLRYGLISGLTLAETYARYLESPGTKAYSLVDAEAMFSIFSRRSARSQLSFGDLLLGAVGQRHQGPALRVAKALWPRWLIKRVLPTRGLLLLVDAVK